MERSLFQTGREQSPAYRSVVMPICESRRTSWFRSISRLQQHRLQIFTGEQLGFYGLLKMMEDTDRSIRKEAFEKWAELYKAISDELDSLYTELIGIRQQMAKNLGFNGYAEDDVSEDGKI